MRYMKEILLKNKYLVLIYISIGIFNAFLTNYKADYFQRVSDGLTDGTVTLQGILFYGLGLILHYSMNYVDEYPSKKLSHGIYLDFKLLALRKISKMDYLASIINFDKIVVFYQGKIVGQGTFEELIKDNAYFIDLYNASVQ